VSRKRFEAAAARIDEKAIRHRDPNVLTDGWRKLKVLLFAERIEESDNHGHTLPPSRLIVVPR
jgi:hypothetical protein